jgi:hypothetical protein
MLQLDHCPELLRRMPSIELQFSVVAFPFAILILFEDVGFSFCGSDHMSKSLARSYSPKSNEAICQVEDNFRAELDVIG